ncbi:DUF4097 family beta strand repeat-containing protein [Actinocorallia sp. A-T 12471]|uniref:DUF4097 family beta strand repeat-containing protein n=1 Tax=Actinocorallia sp. A-T 12471 TaxID=3089813 RepID=UPI0029D2E745|nr:DUF4097 family beta strand repeat-containing protein [Actinocorallia sp. A-T 12471]MDX6739966.1 DUF4097 family beta strand repeat-containing protein [Actinocorallia sp. A-T 12471]
MGGLLLLALLTGCGASADSASPERRDFGAVGARLAISKDQGDLDVRPADVESVRVTRRFDRWALIGGEPTATWALAGGRLTLATDCGGVIAGCAVRYEVVVPRDVAVDIEGENGTISATGFSAALRVRSSNGAIAVSGATGPLDLRSENGELRSAETGSAQVSATSQSGDVDLAFTAVPRQVAVTTENGEVRVTVPRAAYDVTTTTDSGDVSTDLAADASAPRSITARTGSGAITLTGR